MLKLGQQRAPVGRTASLNLEEPQKRAYARPSKTRRHPILRHQRTPSNKQLRPAEEKQLGQQRRAQQKQTSDKSSCVPLRQGIAPLDLVRNKNAKRVVFAQGQMAPGRAIEMRIGDMARNPYTPY